MESKLNERIISLRKEKELTQIQLAEKLNISDKAISKWESGKGDPSLEMLILLSEIFNCSLDYIVKGDNCNFSKVAEIHLSDKDFISAQNIWKQVLHLLKKKVSEPDYLIWLSKIKVIGLFKDDEPISIPFLDINIKDSKDFVLSVPSLQYKNYINKKFGNLILETIKIIDPTIDDFVLEIEDIFSDPLFKESLKLIILNKEVGVRFLQNKLDIGYSRASDIIENMENLQFISKINQGGTREIFINEQKYEELFNEKMI